jgi:hypothetical protein
MIASIRCRAGSRSSAADEFHSSDTAGLLPTSPRVSGRSPGGVGLAGFFRWIVFDRWLFIHRVCSADLFLSKDSALHPRGGISTLQGDAGESSPACSTFLRITRASADFYHLLRRLAAPPVLQGLENLGDRSPKVSCSSFTRAMPDLPARCLDELGCPDPLLGYPHRSRPSIRLLFVMSALPSSASFQPGTITAARNCISCMNNMFGTKKKPCVHTRGLA